MSQEKIIQKIIEKSGKSREKINEMIEDIINEYQNLLDNSGALVFLANKLGVEISDKSLDENHEDQITVYTMIKDLNEKNESVNLIGVIVDIFPIRSFKRKDNSDGYFSKFILKDKSNATEIIAWEPVHEIVKMNNFRKGSILKIIGGNVKKGKSGGFEVHLSKKSKIEFENENIDKNILPSELSEEIFSNLNTIKENDKDLSVRGRVKRVFTPKNYTKPTGESSIYQKIMISDYSGEKTLVIFDEKVSDFKMIREDDIITVSKVYAKRNKFNTELLDLFYSAQSLVNVVVPAKETQIFPDNYAPIIDIVEFKKEPSNASIRGILSTKESLKTIDTKNGPLNLIKIKLTDNTGNLFVNFWGPDIDLLSNIEEGAEISLFDVWGKTNTYSKEIEANFTKKSRVLKNEE